MSTLDDRWKAAQGAGYSLAEFNKALGPQMVSQTAPVSQQHWRGYTPPPEMGGQGGQGGSGNPLSGTLDDIYGAWDKQLGIYDSPKFSELTRSFQDSAYGRDDPYTQQVQNQLIGAQTDAINRGQQQEELAGTRAMDRAGINAAGGLGTAMKAAGRSGARAAVRGASGAIKSKTELLNKQYQGGAKRDLADWMRSEVSNRFGATSGLTAAKGQEVAFSNSPTGVGGSGGPGGPGGGAPWKSSYRTNSRGRSTQQPQQQRQQQQQQRGQGQAVGGAGGGQAWTMAGGWQPAGGGGGQQAAPPQGVGGLTDAGRAARDARVAQERTKQNMQNTYDSMMSQYYKMAPNQGPAAAPQMMHQPGNQQVADTRPGPFGGNTGASPPSRYGYDSNTMPVLGSAMGMRTRNKRG